MKATWDWAPFWAWANTHWFLTFALAWILMASVSGVLQALFKVFHRSTLTLTDEQVQALAQNIQVNQTIKNCLITSTVEEARKAVEGFRASQPQGRPWYERLNR